MVRYKKIEIVIREIEETEDVSEMVLASFTDTEIQQNEAESQTLFFPGLEIHLKEQTVYKDGIQIPFSHYEFFTLYYLAKHPGWVFYKKSRFTRRCGSNRLKNCEAVVTNTISHIRKKLDQENPKDGYIKTVVNSGYKFEA